MTEQEPLFTDESMHHPNCLLKLRGHEGDCLVTAQDHQPTAGKPKPEDLSPRDIQLLIDEVYELRAQNDNLANENEVLAADRRRCAQLHGPKTTREDAERELEELRAKLGRRTDRPLAG